MTLIEMVREQDFLGLIIMGILFVIMGIMINKIDIIKPAGQKDTHSEGTAAKTTDMSSVTAAISAAVNEYRKNN